MAGRRKKVVAKNYEELIVKTNDEITKLEEDYQKVMASYRQKIKSKKTELKQLHKDK